MRCGVPYVVRHFNLLAAALVSQKCCIQGIATLQKHTPREGADRESAGTACGTQHLGHDDSASKL
jgi:hypothetical protein